LSRFRIRTAVLVRRTSCCGTITSACFKTKTTGIPRPPARRARAYPVPSHQQVAEKYQSRSLRFWELPATLRSPLNLQRHLVFPRDGRGRRLTPRLFRPVITKEPRRLLRNPRRRQRTRRTLYRIESEAQAKPKRSPSEAQAKPKRSPSEAQVQVEAKTQSREQEKRSATWIPGTVDQSRCADGLGDCCAGSLEFAGGLLCEDGYIAVPDTDPHHFCSSTYSGCVSDHPLAGNICYGCYAPASVYEHAGMDKEDPFATVSWSSSATATASKNSNFC